MQRIKALAIKRPFFQKLVLRPFYFWSQMSDTRGVTMYPQSNTCSPQTNSCSKNRWEMQMVGWAMVFFNEYQQGRAAVLCWRCSGSRASTYRTATRALGACTLVVVISLSYFSMVSYYKVALQCCYLLLLLWQKIPCTYACPEALLVWVESTPCLQLKEIQPRSTCERYCMGARKNIFSSWRRSSHVRKEYVCRSNKKIFSPPVSYVAI